MDFKHLLFFLLPLFLGGCFAAYIPEPQLDYSSSPDIDSVVAFSVQSESENKKSSIWSMLNGSKSVGHQYLFPGIPVTRLYFERDLSDVLGEYLIKHPKFGRGLRAITNLSPGQVNSLLERPVETVSLSVESFSATAQDFLFLRKASISGSINLKLGSGGTQLLDLDVTRYVSKGTTEVVSELVEEALFDSYEKLEPRLKRLTDERPIAPVVATVICVKPKMVDADNSCLSTNNLSMGMESYFREANLPFLSFRGDCLNSGIKNGYSLYLDDTKFSSEKELLTVRAKLTLKDLKAIGESAGNVRYNELAISEESNTSSSEPDCAAIRKIGRRLAKEFLER